MLAVELMQGLAIDERLLLFLGVGDCLAASMSPGPFPPLVVLSNDSPLTDDSWSLVASPML